MATVRSGLPILRGLYAAFETQFIYLGMKISARKYVMNTLMLSLVLGIIGGLFSFFVLNFPIYLCVAAAILVIVLGVGMMYMILDLSAESRGKKVEAILPDALQLVASNIKSG